MKQALFGTPPTIMCSLYMVPINILFRVKTQNNSMRSQLHRSIPWRQTNGSLMPGAFAGQLRVLGSNVAGPTTWNSVVLVGQKTSSRKINKKRSVTSIYVSLPLHQALKAWHSSYYTSPWIQSMKAKKGVSTSEHLCQYDYIKNDQLVFEGLAKLLIETDTWAFHKWYVYKLQEVNQLGNSNECFSQKNTPIAKQKTTLNLKGNTPLLHYQIITLPITWMFTFKQHQSSHGRQKSITYVYIYTL